MHMVYNILVVYDMQVWCGWVLSEVHMKFMTIGTVLQWHVCNDMYGHDLYIIIYKEYRLQQIVLACET